MIYRGDHYNPLEYTIHKEDLRVFPTRFLNPSCKFKTRVFVHQSWLPQRQQKFKVALSDIGRWEESAIGKSLLTVMHVDSIYRHG